MNSIKEFPNFHSIFSCQDRIFELSVSLSIESNEMKLLFAIMIFILTTIIAQSIIAKAFFTEVEWLAKAYSSPNWDLLSPSEPQKFTQAVKSIGLLNNFPLQKVILGHTSELTFKRVCQTFKRIQNFFS